MTFFEISNEPAFGIGVMRSPGTGLNVSGLPDFPRIGFGPDQAQGVPILSMLFSVWAFYFEGKKVVARVDDVGRAEVWLVTQ